MKIRTFLVCEDIDILKPGEILIKSMMAGLGVSSIPANEKIVVLLTFDEVDGKEKVLKVSIRDRRNKTVHTSSFKLNPDINATALELNVSFPDFDDYIIRFDIDDKFAGKYPFFINKRGESHEE